MKILVTCPPMLGMIDAFTPLFDEYNVEVTAPDIVQTLTEEELKDLVPLHDGWIIGDDPATRDVLGSGHLGRLTACVKWGIGTDNVDFEACKDFGIPITNTPDMFGREVADVAMGYVIGLARHTFEIDRGVRNGLWPKPAGVSLSDKTVAVVGLGDIGKNTAKRLIAADMHVIGYDPYAVELTDMPMVERAEWPNRLEELDFLVMTCALTKSSYHLLDEIALGKIKAGVRVINVGRGPLVDERALESALSSGIVHSAALDVFEVEPLPEDSILRGHPHCIFGSHNSSNTSDAVVRTSQLAIERLMQFLGREKGTQPHA